VIVTALTGKKKAKGVLSIWLIVHDTFRKVSLLYISIRVMWYCDVSECIGKF